MHPILSDRKKLLIYLIIWMVAGFLLSYSVSMFFGVRLLASTLFAVPMVVLYGEINLSSWYIAKTFPIGKTKLWKLLGAVAGSIFVASTIWVILCWLWIEFLERMLGIPIPINNTWLHLGILYGIGKQLYIISLALSYFIAAFETSRNAERDAFELKLLAQSAELKALRMQINPHFLFNSLNSINALIPDKPETARAMTTLLADFFRKSLQFGTKDFIPLNEELQLLQNYLDIEKIRFGSRLKVSQSIDEKVVNAKLPPLLLQPIVENAIKHGISTMLEGGTLKIQIEKKHERVFVAIENPFDEDAPNNKGAGLGLDIVRKRLHTVFGGNSDVQTFREKNIFRVVLFFPISEYTSQ